MAVEDRVASLLEPFQQLLGDLSPRDRTLLFGTIVLVLLVIGFVGQSYMAGKTQSLERMVQDRRANLDAVLFTATEYEATQEEVSQLEEELRSFRSFSLTGYLEETAGQAGITGENLRDVKDRGSESGQYFTTRRVEVTLRNISLEALTRYVWAIEHAPQHLRIDNLRAKGNRRDRSQIDVTIEVLFFEVVEDSPA